MHYCWGLLGYLWWKVTHILWVLLESFSWEASPNCMGFEMTPCCMRTNIKYIYMHRKMWDQAITPCCVRYGNYAFFLSYYLIGWCNQSAKYVIGYSKSHRTTAKPCLNAYYKSMSSLINYKEGFYASFQLFINLFFSIAYKVFPHLIGIG